MNRLRTLVVGVACAAAVVAHAEASLAGKWRGATGSGRQVVLDLKVNGQELTGRLTLAQQSAEIAEGKAEGKTFSAGDSSATTSS